MIKTNRDARFYVHMELSAFAEKILKPGQNSRCKD
jgi:hypothetical protein